jgi:tetratricopeptide (TPR) repeat protein
MSTMSEAMRIYKEAFQAFARGDVETAIAGYQQAIASNPKFGLAFQALAEAYGRRGELDQAITAIQSAIAADPDESLYLTSLSRFLQRQGKIPEAEEAAARALQLQQARRG